MRVFQINSVCGIKSTGRICTDLSEILYSLGHESKIAYGREYVPLKHRKNSYRIGSDFLVKINALKARIFDNEGFNAKRQTKKLIKEIENFNPDIIHLHNLHGYYLNVRILFDYLKKADKPVVWTLHDCWAFTGHCSHFDYVNCDKWKTECHNCPQKHEYPASKVFDRSKKNYELKKQAFTGVKNLTIITPSEWLAEKVRESFLGEYEVIAIPNGVDLDMFKPTESDFKKEHNLLSKTVLLGVATSWGEKKGLSRFIELSKVINEEYAIVLVGVTLEQKKFIPENVLCIERTDSKEELVKIYSSADFLLNLSVEETMGLATIEAFACGTPAIVSNKTAVPEVVTDSSGLVLENLSTEEIISKLELAKNMAFSTEDVAKNYEKSLQYKKYLEIYAERCNV